jgi:hypothetical protein
MKSLYYLSLFAACVCSATATTVIAAGGLDGYQFGVTSSTSIPSFTPFTATGQSMATITVGAFNGGVFSAFAATDSTPPSFGSSGLLIGKWLGSASDNSSDADEFAGDQIWFRITTVVGGQTYTGYFADNGVLFPSNDGGLDDTQTVTSYSLDTISPNSTGTWTIDAANQQITLAVPEPSVSLLGGLGLVCLLRRKR